VIVIAVKKRRLLTTGGAWLAAAGVALLGWCAVSIGQAYIYQRESIAALDREILSRPLKPVVASTAREGALLGSVSIPRVGVSSVVVEGTDDRDLALSVGHIPGTAMPGQNGNVALAAHRDTLFRGLENIRPRDDILLTTPGGTKLYEVESTRVVSPDDVSVLDDTGKPLLTLVTCYPFHYIGPAPKRFIVQARLLGQ
jgi:LPXTG-site transpeptidase (sortase) family protein